MQYVFLDVFSGLIFGLMVVLAWTMSGGGIMFGVAIAAAAMC